MRPMLLVSALAIFGCSGAEPRTLPAPPAATSGERVIPFETGFVFAKNDKADSITIDEVRGDREGFVADGTYDVRGHYELRSLPEARLAVYVTNGRTDEGAEGQARITRGTGTFELKLKILAAGYPHVSFYPDGGGEGIAGAYFGSGDSVLRHGW